VRIVASQPSGHQGRRAARGVYVVSNWVWLVIVLALIGIIVWGWAWDFGK
jgi:hypothetical protein